MKAVRQESPGGKPVIESIPVPRPGKGQVLVRMHASPVNPSDLALLKGGYMERNYPFTPGLEGSGEVVESGGGILARLRVGKRVACSPEPKGDGTWAEYMVTSATRTSPLPKGTSPEQGSMMLVNPMTALVLMKIARQGHYAAVVNNAAASAMGKMLIRLARQNNMPLINIVRKEDQVRTLTEMGAGVVLNSADPAFVETLKQHCSRPGPILFLDAVGGDHAARLLEAATKGSRMICYARLSGDPLLIEPVALMQEGVTIEGFQLGNWLNTQSILSKLKLLGQVKKALPEVLSSPVHRTVPMEEVEQAIVGYRENMSAGKVILTMTVPLHTFPGVPLEYAEVLKSRGISHAMHLLDATDSGEDLEQLASETGIPVNRIEELRALCNLSEIPSVGPDMARLFYHAGFRSVKAVATVEETTMKEKLYAAGQAYPETAGLLKDEEMKRFRQQARAMNEHQKDKEQHL